jgi:hypothetical protein
MNSLLSKPTVKERCIQAVARSNAVTAQQTGYRLCSCWGFSEACSATEVSSERLYLGSVT